MLSPSQYILVTTRLTTGSTGLVGDSYRKPSIATIAGKGGNPNDKRKGPMVRCHFPFHWYTLQSVTKNTLNISCVSVWNTVPNRSQIKWPLGTQMVSAYLWTKHPIYILWNSAMAFVGRWSLGTHGWHFKNYCQGFKQPAKPITKKRQFDDNDKTRSAKQNCIFNTGRSPDLKFRNHM